MPGAGRSVALRCRQAMSGPSHASLPAFRWTSEADGVKTELFQASNPHLMGCQDVVRAGRTLVCPMSGTSTMWR